MHRRAKLRVIKSTNFNSEYQMDVYRALMAHRIHQDELLWSRVQTLIAVQGAILTGSYLVRSYWLGPLIDFAGDLLTSFIGLIL